MFSPHDLAVIFVCVGGLISIGTLLVAFIEYMSED